MRTTQAELDEIEALVDDLDRLSQDEGEGAYMPMPGGIDGFLTGLLILPEPVPKEEWLNELFWESLGLFPDEKVARLTQLLTARRAIIAAQLLQGSLAFQPLYDVDDRNDDILWEIWIEGFDRAVQLRYQAWTALFESDDDYLVEALVDLAMLIGMTRIETKRAKILDAKEHEQVTADAPDMIPALVETVFRRQRGFLSHALPSKPPQFYHVAKVGRNDPCPCGSGRKYKKCCGAAG